MKRDVLLATLTFVMAMASGSITRPDDVPRPEHPNPLMVRPHWENLNGPWQFRFDPEDQGRNERWFEAGAEGFDREILVPFPWESELSGIGEVESPDIGWYRRTFTVPEDFPEDHQVWLNFGAVDFEATVWVNGRRVTEHEGGYTPFSADVTHALRADGGPNVVVVRAFDPTDPSLPTGKQIGWYTPVSGIWQTVWLEARPAVFIRGFFFRPELDPAKVTVGVGAMGLAPEGRRIALEGGLTASIRADDPTVEAASAELGWSATGSQATGTARLEASIDEPKLWSPESPHLYDATIELKDEAGNVVDSVRTYFGLRTIARGTFGDEPFERFLLNGQPVYIRGALDQSYNPEGLYTAPSDEFLRRDIELAKALGLNCLRIHIKVEEPRRLYWADKLGVLIMQDMPNTWRQNPTAREAWRSTMRQALFRDRNHPSIWSWVAFNETWGLGDRDYREDRDTQAWVKEMVSEIRAIDPTRLVEDNSPDKRDHVEGTDINSWHFYIDDDEQAKRHIAEVVERTEPGSDFNYVPGETQGTEPLMNSEYGAVSAGGGDRDISWGFRYLTTLLRMHNKIQGYIYTELSDIEWEHNGFVNYDRSPKEYGYEAFVPDMTVADLNGADFIGFDAPPAIVAEPDETIRVPLFVSHYSDREAPPTLTWAVTGFDGLGEPVQVPARRREVSWTRYEVTPLDPLAFRIAPGPFVGAVALVLEDPDGERIAANFVNVVVRDQAPQPRVERLSDHLAAVRFAPEDYARQRWTEVASPPSGKVYGRGHGFLEYRLTLPESIVEAHPESIELRLEVAAKAGREKVDWPERVNALDYPQTDVRKWPTTLEVTVNGHSLARLELEDDPADARGVLSHLARVEHGSYGYQVRIEADLPEPLREELAEGQPLVIRLAVPDDAEHAGGLCLFGAETGRFAFDPTVLVETQEALPDDLGVDPTERVAIDTAAARPRVLLPSGDLEDGPESSWAYATRDPGPSWHQPDFDDSDWPRGRGGFGTPGTPAIQVGTLWDSPTIWIRSSVDVPELAEGDRLTLRLFHDEDVAIFVNGLPLHQARGYVTAYQNLVLNDEQLALFRPGANTIAVVCRQTGGGQGIDVGLSLLRAQ